MHRFLAFATTIIIGGISLPAFAQDADTSASAEKQVTAADVFIKPEPVEADKPLVIIRFNQSRVNFDNALSKAIGSAEKIKPDMQYEVVSFVPERSNPTTSRQNLQAIVGTMQRYGADISRITWRSELSNGTHQEIYINIQ
ncbi:MAG: hypothetical protein ACK502_03665 [Alphaproteobacteria bacterium]